MKLFPKTPLTLLIILVAGYAYMSEFRRHQPDIVPKSPPLAEEVDEKQEEKPGMLERGLDSLVSRIQENETGMAIFGAYVQKQMEQRHGSSDAGIVHIHHTNEVGVSDIVAGKGLTLHCGASAVITYNAFTKAGLPFDAVGDVNPLEFTTGAGEVIRGLENGIIGMREGGRRRISIPSYLAFDDRNFNSDIVEAGEPVTYDVTLKRIKDGPYKTGIAVHEISKSQESGKHTVLCGDNVTLNYRFMKPGGGDIEAGSGIITFTVGSDEVPPAFNMALPGMEEGGEKKLQIPVALMRPSGKVKADFNGLQTIEAEFFVVRHWRGESLR